MVPSLGSVLRSKKCGANEYDWKNFVNSSGLMCGLLVKQKKNCVCLLLWVLKKIVFVGTGFFLRTDDQSLFWFLSLLLLLFFFPKDVSASPMSCSLFADTSQ